VNVFDDTTSAPGNASAAPDTIGSYRLIHELGRGGMGTVYLAVRDDDAFQKRVAIKVLRPGMDSEAIVRRFRHERQILASLQHPYIAGLLDGGTTASGLPYFAMEYVEGQNIAEYCESRRLETTARLDLFRKVCAAVQHAHQNLVIHRDIKPANVLVTADGTPKLLDFGIAKLLNPEVGGHTLAPTVAGLYLMTPEYASPEQVRGEPVTTATDVYSLGVLLYELLTGRRPYRITSRAPADVAEVICSVTPERPSTAVTAPQTPGRADLTERLRRRLAGDLDNIVLKALSKEPDRRYASVDQFSEDIHRHLVGLPVIARKDTVRYRAAKFVRRNRAMVAAAVVAFAALVAAASLSTWQARVASRERQRAESRFDDVRQLANAYLFEFHDAIRDLPGSTAARQLLVTRGLQYLDKLAADAGDRADLRREVADAYVRVGDVQGRPLNPNLGDTAGAVASYEKALAMYESLGARDSSDPLLRRGLATGLIRLSAIRTATGDSAKALELARDALGVLRGITGEAAAGAEVQRELAVAHSQVGDLLSATGDTEAALQERRTTLTIMERLVAVAPADLNNLRQLGVAYHKLGNSLGNPNYPNVGDYAGALDYLQRSGEVFRKALELAPTNATFRRNAAVIDSNISDVLAATGRNDEALARLRQAVATFRSLAEADPANVFAENDVSITTFKIGQMLEAAGQLDAAITEYERALAIHQRLAAADPGNAEFKEQIASDLDGLAGAQAKRGNRSAAIASHSQAISLTRELQRDDPGNVELQVAVALSLIGRGATLVRFGALERARDDYAEAVELLSRLERDEVIGGSDLRTLADARAALAKLPTP
jgi:non-specific serine/threonine protein kinase/serine/threonine-protein kinase